MKIPLKLFLTRPMTTISRSMDKKMVLIVIMKWLVWLLTITKTKSDFEVFRELPNNFVKKRFEKYKQCSQPIGQKT